MATDREGSAGERDAAPAGGEQTQAPEPAIARDAEPQGDRWTDSGHEPEPGHEPGIAPGA